MSSDVSRASHTHQVPQVGLPQIAPVASASTVKDAPIGAAAAATAWASLMRQTRPIAAPAAIVA